MHTNTQVYHSHTTHYSHSHTHYHSPLTLTIHHSPFTTHTHTHYSPHTTHTNAHYTEHKHIHKHTPLLGLVTSFDIT